MDKYSGKTIADVRAEILVFRSEKPPRSWEKIGELYNLKGMHIWKIANRNYDPLRPDIRAALGLSEMVHVVVVSGGVAPSGSQLLKVDFCECGRPYVSNHPRRSKCFICSPYRRRSPAQVRELKELL